jgi:hypothetical protein
MARCASLLLLLIMTAVASPAVAELHQDLNFLLDLYSAAACTRPSTALAATLVRAALLRDGMLNIRTASACWTLEEWQVSGRAGAGRHAYGACTHTADSLTRHPARAGRPCQLPQAIAA